MEQYFSLTQYFRDKYIKESQIQESSMRARELADSYSLKQLQSRYDQIFRDMEQEAEPEGGPIADQYADELHAYEEALQIAKQKIRGGSTNSGEMTYDQAIKKHYGKSPTGVHPSGKPKFDESLNEATDDEIAQAEFGMDYEQLGPEEKEWVDDVQYEMADTLLNESEKSWNAVDVSRTAEKELSNKEWNERTAKKLEMLMKLNAAGKFKKDFDEERLQGWVDKNFSWERVSRQFKLNEASSEYTEGDKVKFNPSIMIDKGFENDITHYDGLMGIVTKISQDELEIKLNKSITPPGGGNINDISLWKSKGDYEMIEKSGGLGEGSCGYTPDGKPRNKPAGPHLLKLKERIFNSFRNQ